MVGPDDRSGRTVELRLPRWVVGSTHREERRPAGSDSHGQRVISVAFNGGRAGATPLADGEDRLLDDRGLGGVESGRPENADPPSGVGLDQHLGHHRGGRQGGFVDVDRYPLVRAKESEAG